MADRIKGSDAPSQPTRIGPQSRPTVALTRVGRRRERVERFIDEGIGAYLNAKFPYRSPTDQSGRQGER
jgi:hypothetical protein